MTRRVHVRAIVDATDAGSYSLENSITYRGAPACQHSHILPLRERTSTGGPPTRRYPACCTKRCRLVLGHSNFKRVNECRRRFTKELFTADWRSGSPDETLNRTIADTPIVAELMREARREWPVRVEKDFSYSASAYAGDRCDPGGRRGIVSRSCVFDRGLNCHGVGD